MAFKLTEKQMLQLVKQNFTSNMVGWLIKLEELKSAVFGIDYVKVNFGSYNYIDGVEKNPDGSYTVPCVHIEEMKDDADPSKRKVNFVFTDYGVVSLEEFGRYGVIGDIRTNIEEDLYYTLGSNVTGYIDECVDYKAEVLNSKLKAISDQLNDVTSELSKIEAPKEVTNTLQDASRHAFTFEMNDRINYKTPTGASQYYRNYLLNIMMNKGSGKAK